MLYMLTYICYHISFRYRRNAVEEGKIYNNQVNVFVYSFTLGFTFILVGYAVMVTYRNWQSSKNMVECEQ